MTTRRHKHGYRAALVLALVPGLESCILSDVTPHVNYRAPMVEISAPAAVDVANRDGAVRVHVTDLDGDEAVSLVVTLDGEHLFSREDVRWSTELWPVFQPRMLDAHRAGRTSTLLIATARDEAGHTAVDSARVQLTGEITVERREPPRLLYPAPDDVLLETTLGARVRMHVERWDSRFPFAYQVAIDSTFSTLVAEGQVVSASSVELDLTTGTYHWRVRAVDPALADLARAPWSESRSFMVVPAGSNVDWGGLRSISAVTALADGSFAMIGYTGSASRLERRSADFSLLWSYELGTTSMILSTIHPRPDGSFVVSFARTGDGPRALRIDGSGSLVWDATLRLDDTSASQIRTPQALFENIEGDVSVVLRGGTSFSGVNSYVVKLDASGGIATVDTLSIDPWRVEFSAADTSLVWLVRSAVADATLLRTGTTGSITWERAINVIGSFPTEAPMLARDAEGGTILVSTLGEQVYAASFSAMGALRWERVLSPPAGDGRNVRAHGMSVDERGDVYITGSSDPWSWSSGWTGRTQRAVMAWCLDSQGQLLWSRLAHPPSRSHATGLHVIPDGTSGLVFGYLGTSSYESDSQFPLVVRLEAEVR